MRHIHLATPRASLGVALVAFALASGCQAAGRSNAARATDVSELPPEVCEAIDRAAQMYPQPLNGAKWSEAHTIGSEHPVYQVRGTNARGNRVEMEITSAGRVIEVEEHGIPMSEVPTAVVEALKAKRPEFQPARAEAIYQGGNAQPVAYGFEAEVNGKKVEVYVSADGKTFLN
jgi:hypothetical protein